MVNSLKIRRACEVYGAEYSIFAHEEAQPLVSMLEKMVEQGLRGCSAKENKELMNSL